MTNQLRVSKHYTEVLGRAEVQRIINDSYAEMRMLGMSDAVCRQFAIEQIEAAADFAESNTPLVLEVA